MLDCHFPKTDRLLKRPDFVNVNQAGKRRQSRHFIVRYLPNQRGVTRLGIAAGRKVGNAVCRNRVKRLVREFFRLHKAHLPQGYDFVVIVKKIAGSLTLGQVDQELGEIFLDKEFFV